MTDKQTPTASLPAVKNPPKRTYQKHDTAYWADKTIKATRRNANKRRMLQYAGMLGRAAKLASTIYKRLLPPYRKRCYYRQLVALSMELLKAAWCKADILAQLTSPGWEIAPSQTGSHSNELSAQKEGDKLYQPS